MDSRWVKGLQGEKKEERLKEVRSYRRAFEAVLEILESDFHKKESVRDYSDPGWVHKQIAVNEYNQALADIKALLNIKDS